MRFITRHSHDSLPGDGLPIFVGVILFYSVTLDDDLNSAMTLMAEHDLNQVLVLQQGQLVGLLSRADIIRHLQLSQELGMKR